MKIRIYIMILFYAQSSWRTPFEATLRNMLFSKQDGSVIEIPMMYQKASNYYGKVDALGATVLDIPYRVSFYIETHL
jgi:hypothetical protein